MLQPEPEQNQTDSNKTQELENWTNSLAEPKTGEEGSTTKLNFAKWAYSMMLKVEDDDFHQYAYEVMTITMTYINKAKTKETNTGQTCTNNQEREQKHENNSSNKDKNSEISGQAKVQKSTEQDEPIASTSGLNTNAENERSKTATGQMQTTTRIMSYEQHTATNGKYTQAPRSQQ